MRCSWTIRRYIETRWNNVAKFLFQVGEILRIAGIATGAAAGVGAIAAYLGLGALHSFITGTNSDKITYDINGSDKHVMTDTGLCINTTGPSLFALNVNGDTLWSNNIIFGTFWAVNLN